MATNKKLTLSHQARTDIAHYIRHCDYEIGGFGYVTMNENGDFFVDEIFLVEQTVTGGSVDFMDDGLAYAIQKATDDNRIEDLKFCWHSHVNMSAFWSSTDESMIEGANNGMTPYLVSLVQNKSGEFKTRVDFFPNGPLGQFTKQVEYELDLYYQQPEIPDHITETYDKLVTEKTEKYTYPSGYKSKPISQGRADYLQKKVYDDGYASLNSYEKDQYEEYMMAEWDKLDNANQMGWYGDYDDDFGTTTVDGTATDVTTSIDDTPLSDTEELTEEQVEELMKEPSK